MNHVPGQPQPITLPTPRLPREDELPGWMRQAGMYVDGAVRKGLDVLVPEEHPTPDGAQITAPLDRAKEAERANIDHNAQFGNADAMSGHAGELGKDDVWPLSQVLHGRILVAQQTGDWTRVNGMFAELERYRQGDAYTTGPGTGSIFYDDNAWIGLAAMKAFDSTKDPRFLATAQRMVDVVRSAEHPDGGVWWTNEKTGRYAPGIAPSAQLALNVYGATKDPALLDFAKRQAEWMHANLENRDGLIIDNIKNDGSRGEETWTYNQGNAIGLDVQLYQATGEQKYLDRAKKLADTTLRTIATPDQLFHNQAPAFNAILFRNLFLLDSVAPDPRYEQLLKTHLDEVWTTARDPKTGLFDQNGIVAYDMKHPGAPIDQGAFSQMFAMLAMTREQRAHLM